jgi:hypothetical protein
VTGRSAKEVVVNESAKRAFIQSVPPDSVPLVLRLEEAVSGVRADFDTRFSYGMLMFTLDKDFRHWICAISVTKKAANLRFLYGVLLDDPRSVLRAGTSILKTMDFASLEDIDTELVTDYVREAVDKLETFKAMPPQELPKGDS